MRPHPEIQEEQYYRAYHEIIRKVMEHENAFVFFRPVDPVADGAPDYHTLIVQPMSIFTVQEKLDRRHYRCPSEFMADMRQIWANAKTYNHESHGIYKTAHSMAARFEILAASLPLTISTAGRACALQNAVELRFARYRELRKMKK